MKDGNREWYSYCGEGSIDLKDREIVALKNSNKKLVLECQKLTFENVKSIDECNKYKLEILTMKKRIKIIAFNLMKPFSKRKCINHLLKLSSDNYGE